MSTDKTLADAKPGGMVRLEDQNNALAASLRQIADAQYTRRQRFNGRLPADVQEVIRMAAIALSAQPSPAGLDALASLPLYRLADDANGNRGLHRDDTGSWVKLQDVERALAARKPAGEPVAVVVPGAPTRCRHCESTDLEWFAHVRAVNDVPHGRLTTHDVGCVFVLGCNECSETLHTVKADSIASLLAAPPVQAVNLGQQLDRYDAGLLGDGGGGDVAWWQDYIRAELDRAHEFYQDQADAHG